MNRNLNLVEPVVLITAFVILSFGENKANGCYFIKIAIFAIVLYILMIFRNSDEHFQSLCYPNSVRAPTLVSYLSKSKGTCINESARDSFPDLINSTDDMDDMGEASIGGSCPMPMDRRIPAEKSEQTKLKGFCKLPPDYNRY